MKHNSPVPIRRVVQALLASALVLSIIPTGFMRHDVLSGAASIGNSGQPVEQTWLRHLRGGTISDLDITRHRLFIMNAWDNGLIPHIRALNPTAKILVYKDMASTRNYAGAVVNGQDATLLPTGVGYIAAQAHPEWFLRDAQNQVIG